MFICIGFDFHVRSFSRVLTSETCMDFNSSMSFCPEKQRLTLNISVGPPQQILFDMFWAHTSFFVLRTGYHRHKSRHMVHQLSSLRGMRVLLAV